MANVRVKICCISSPEEARLAIQAGADALGLVGPMPSGPGVLSLSQIADILPHLPASVDSFLLTSETSLEGIHQQHRLAPTQTLQLVDAVLPEVRAQLKQQLPDVQRVQVIHVQNEASIEEALAAVDSTDILLLDSGNPNLDTKELGGTGRIHNWNISRQIVVQSPVPVYLAGGLTPDNVQRAIETVQPFGVDVCSGVRTQGQLDPEKLTQFFQKVKRL